MMMDFDHFGGIMQHYLWNNIGLGMSKLVILLILEVVCVLGTPKLIIGLMLIMGFFFNLVLVT